jgi:hypothetical protein
MSILIGASARDAEIGCFYVAVISPRIEGIPREFPEWFLTLSFIG